jgi:hypothetical protein
MRVVGVPLALAAAIGLLLEPRTVRRERVWANSLALFAGTVATGLFFYWQFHRPQHSVVTASYAAEASMMASRPIAHWLWVPFRNFFETGPELCRVFSGQEIHAAAALFLFWLPTLAGAWRCVKDRKYLFVFATLGYLGAILLLRSAMSRYLLPISPLLLFFFIHGIREILQLKPAALLPGRPVCAAVLAVLVLMNLPKDLRLAYAVHREDFVAFRKDWPPWIQAARFLHTHVQGDQKFVSASGPILLAYLSGRPCIQIDRNRLQSPPSTDEILASLQEQGVQFIVSERRGRSYPFHQRLAQTVRQRREFQLVFQNDAFQIYRTSKSLRSANRREIEVLTKEPTRSCRAQRPFDHDSR